MLVVMCVTLYTSRVILSALGETDYGIYNVVGGIVTIMGFLNGALGSSTSRFLTYELGAGEIDRLKKTFAATLNMHIAIAILVVILGETIGLWFFYTQLNIPAERVQAAFWVYQFSIITSCISFTQVPYNASLIAHENMSIYAKVGLYEAFSKLLIAYFIVISPIDNLVFYALLLLINSAGIQLFYRFYTRIKYTECRFSFFYNKKLYRKLISYGGWDLFGSSAVVCQNQGINILLNIFFGPTVNAARAVAYQVQSGVTAFTNTFLIAVRPQVIKSCAIQNYRQMYNLTFYAAKFAFLLMLTLILPICFEMDFILGIWLGNNIPEYTSVFAIIVLLTVLMETWHQGYLMAFHAIGKIKAGNIWGGTLMILSLPVSYLLLKFLDMDAYIVFIVIFVCNFIMQVIGWFLIYHYVPFDWKALILKVYLSTILIAILSLLMPTIIHIVMIEGWKRFFTTLLTTSLSVLLLSWWIAFEGEERRRLKTQLIKIREKYFTKFVK